MMDIHELRQFESVYKPSKEIAFCWLRNQYVQLSTEENHTEIVDHANDSLRIWQAAKAQAVPKGFVLVPKEPTDEMLFAASGRDIVAEHYGGENIMWSEIRETWKAMLEIVQEPANESE